MTRLLTTSKWTVLESLAPGDDPVELQISADLRRGFVVTSDLRGSGDRISSTWCDSAGRRVLIVFLTDANIFIPAKDA